MATAGRPRKFDRGKAVEIVMAEFWEHGYTHSSVLSVSRKLGITRSSFYNSFETLDQLFSESLGLYIAKMQEGEVSLMYGDSAKAVSPSIIRQIRRFFKALCRSRGNDPKHRGCLVVNSIAEMGNLPDSGKELVKMLVDAAIANMTSTVSAAVKSGELPKQTTAKKTGEALFALACGINSMSRIYHDEKTLWSVADTTLTGLGIVE